METKSQNCFRFATCLVTVGTEVLHKLLKFNIQTCCFSEYHELWLEKVNFHGQSNELKVLWYSFDQQYKALDASSQQILQSLLAKWKSSCGPTTMEIRQQLSVLKDWDAELHDFMTNHATQQDTLKKWSSEIQSLDALNTSRLTLMKKWTQEFINLCQANQLDLVRLTEQHHERTNNFAAAFLNKLECCISQRPGELHVVLKTFQQEEVNVVHALQTELQAFFISWQSKINQLLDQWITFISSSPHQQILRSLVADVKNALSRVHQMCQTGLSNICSTWHKNLRKKLSEWNNELQQFGASTSDIQDLAKTWCTALQAFPAASEQQIRDFFELKRHDLQILKSRHRIITEPQWSSLYPTQGYIDVRKLDITLLSTLHRNVFPICPPELGWSGQLLETDHSTGADLMRLKQFRNEQFGHISVPTLTSCEFEKLWTKLNASLHRLSTALDDEFKEEVEQKIAQLKTCPFDFGEDIKLKLELMNQVEGDILDLGRSTHQTVQECFNQVQTMDTAFKTQIDPMKERIERVEKSMNRVERCISTPSDSLSKTDMLEGMECISERMTRLEIRMTRIEANQKINRTKLEERIDQKINRSKLEERIEQTRGRVEMHKSDNSDIHVRTRALDHAKDILLKQKHIVLQGKPGEGKTYLALSLVADLISKDKEIAPVEIHNTNEWDEMVDTRLPLVVLLDDVLGKYGVSETDLDRWKKISELVYPRFSRSSIFLIVCIRTQTASCIKVSLRINEALFLFNSDVVDISAEPHCLTKEEREQMLKKYTPNVVEKSTIKDIIEMENVIGFAQICNICSTSQNVSVDLKDIFANNMFLVEEIQDMSKKSPEIYTFLVLLMLSGGYLSLEKNRNELNKKMKTIYDYCRLKNLNISEMKYIGHSLCGTLLEYNTKTMTFKFQHDCIETAVIVSFGKDYPDVILEHCSLKHLSKICYVANELDRLDGDSFLNFKIMIADDHFRAMCERFNEGLKSGERDSFQSIAEGLVWKNQCFVDHFVSDTMTFADNVLNFLSKTDPDGWSLLVHLIHAKNTLAVKCIIKTISQCCLRENNLAARQLVLATTNACLTKEKEILDDLIKVRDKVDDFVMLAAASTGNVSIMEMLIVQGGDINATISIKNRKDLSNAIKNCISYPKISSNHHDINLFHIACFYGLTDMVKYLINSYPELVHRKSSLGRTAVHFLACSENIELMRAFSGKLSDISEAVIQPPKHSWRDISETDNNGANAVHIAALNDNLKIVKYLIENIPQMILQNDKNGWTAMHYAANGGNVPVMETLIQAGFDINARTSDGSHILHIAASNDNLPIVKYLIESNPPVILQNDKNGLTAMHDAATGGSVPVMKALIQAGFDINARTNDGVHVLHIAARNDNLPIVKYLIESYPPVILQNDKNGLTAMHSAANGGSVPVMEALIQAGFYINARTNHGSHVLHIAARNDNLPIVKYLIESYPPVILQNDKNGWTAMHSVANGGSVPVMETLIQAGFDINARTNHGSHVLHIAASNDNLPIVKYLIESNPPVILQNDKNGWTAMHSTATGGRVLVMETLIQAGFDINARTNDGSHVLHIAARNDNLLIVKYLIESNPPVILQNDKNGLTVMHYAATGGSVPVMESLIQAGFDINARTNDGSHVLHIAARNDNLPIVKYLIESNPPVILQNDKNGLTAMHSAATGGSVPVMETLIRAGFDINARTNDGSHVLHIAASNDNLSIVKYLIESNPPVILQNDKNGLTAMHSTANGGSVTMMETLIQAGFDINARTNDGVHVLHIAASNDNLPIVKYLIESNPPVILENDKNGLTAIHYAATGGSVPVMETLIEAGFDINARTNHGVHVLHIAASNDNLPIVKYLIESKPAVILQNDKNGWTAMHSAANGGSVPVMETLIKAGFDINARTNDGFHVLHIAASNDNLPIVKYLIEINPPVILQNDKKGWTAMHYAATGGSVPVMETLIQAGSDINARTNDGVHVLHIAGRNDNLPIVKYLIESNPPVILQNDKNGLTAMHYAATGGRVPVMETLIRAGFDINARTNDGVHVLHIAASNNNLPIVKYLIENIPQMILQNDKNGWTAMHYAANGGNVPVMETLIQAGFDINARTSDGSHILHIAASNDNLPIVKYLIESNPPVILQNDKNGLTAMHDAATGGSVPVMKALIQAGFDINARTNDGVHVLHIAARNDNLPIVKYLIESYPPVILQNDKNGLTAMHSAANGGSVPVMEALIQAGFYINARTNHGSHVLHIAARNDNLPIVKYLIESYPPVILQNDKNGWTAMHSVANGGSVPVMETLIQAGFDINARTNHGSHVLHIAASNDNLPIVKYLIESNPPVILQNDKNGWTAMHSTATGGRVLVMETLIQAGFDINARTNDGSHVLHIAARNDNLLIVKYLIESNPPVILQNDKNGLTVMHYAATGGSVPVMESLIQAGFDINARTNDGSHVLHIAARNDNLPIVKYLIESNPPVILQNDKNGLTAMHSAATGGSVPVMETLIRAGFDINARTNDGSHVLHIAGRNDNLSIVKYLIESNPPVILQNDKNGLTAMHSTSNGGSVTMMETLIQAGFDINARTNDGVHVLHIAASNDNLPIVKYLIESNPPVILENDKNGLTAIHYAATGGSVPVMETLIEAGFDINARTNHGVHVLHIAASNDNLPIVKYLIESKPAVILQNDKNGWTAMHSAANGGSVPVMETLIKAGFDINARTNDGFHVLHIAASNDNLPIVKYLIEINPPVILQNDKKGWTAMHYAATGGSVPVMETLIQAGSDINARTNDGVHVLHIAGRNDNLPIVKYLIESNPPVILQNDKNGLTAMHYAATGGRVPVMETLIRAGFDINARTNDGVHVLHIAASNNNLPIVKYLIESYPPVILQNDKNGWTPMHSAANGGSVPVMETLIQAGFDINARTNHGSHVLHIAASNDNLPIVKYLIESNPPVILQNDKNGLTAMHYAANGGSVPVMETLIQAGFDINARTNDGVHVLHIAARNDNLSIVKYLIEINPPVILQNDTNGWTSMHYAANGGSVPLMEALIQAGFDINARTNDGVHVLHIAARNDNLPTVKYLIECSPPVILQNDKNGWTAMHSAATGGRVPVMETLIQAGFDINARTNDGVHVLHIAASNDNLPIVKYLIESNPPVILENDKNGWTAMHDAANGGSFRVNEAL